eukprot:m.239148 g.239148  ORF g.239148 m.239148 type:complete len:55 (+) comp40176_c1_seq22:98-262(+)
MMAVEKVEKNTPEKIIANHWESLFNNCGHCHRKLESDRQILRAATVKDMKFTFS